MIPLRKPETTTAERRLASRAPLPLPLQSAAAQHRPVASPAHDLQRALLDAGYRAEPFRHRPMSNAMLFLTALCVYTLTMLMLLSGLGA